MGTGVPLIGFELWLHKTLAVGPWSSFLVYLLNLQGFFFSLLFNMEITLVSILQDHLEDEKNFGNTL